MADTNASANADPARTSAFEVLLVFLRLGCTSFGGPIAHLGYFRTEFVERRRWLDEAGYAELVALCQFLPGPASSQVGFAIGLMRGGAPGALAAWLGFTVPSAALMIAFAYGATALDGPLAAGALHGLKLVAVSVVAQAVWGMMKTLTPDVARLAIALGAGALAVGVGGAFGQVGAILLGALAGLLLAGRAFALAPAPAAGVNDTPTRSSALPALLVAAAGGLLLALPLLSSVGIGGHALALFDAFYRAGALVFGGGHVVLPLIEEAVVAEGWVSHDAFLAGYGAAQALPGPLFAIAAYLGAAGNAEPNGVAGAAIALVAIFLPGLLLVAGALPFWRALRGWRAMRAAIIGVNAAVVGILAAALWDPLWTSAVHSSVDAALAAAGFAALVFVRVPALAVVLALAGAGAVLGVA